MTGKTCQIKHGKFIKGFYQVENQHSSAIMTKSKLSQMKIALVYDRVNTNYGGAEKVLLELHKIFPSAPLFTSVYDRKKAKWAQCFDVRTSFLQKIPILFKHHRLLAPLMPMAFESLDLSEFELIISVTSAEAKGIITNPNQTHICYLLTPPRYLYSHKEETLTSNFIINNFFVRFFLNKILSYLTWWDQIAIHRPDYIIPISRLVSKRVKEFYALECGDVVYPPVEIAQAKTKGNHDYFLVVSRLVYYKNIHLVVEACKQINQKLVIVGDGPELNKLKKISNKLITFYQNLDEKKLHDFYQNCKAVIMAGEEDFGIVALEANSYGKPVVINHKSGSAELIIDGVHGVHIHAQNLQSIVTALTKAQSLTYDRQLLIQNAIKYDTNKFRKNFSKSIENYLLKLDLKQHFYFAISLVVKKKEPNAIFQ